MLQLALPICSFASEVVTVVYKGGTDTDMAPPIDHYHLVSPVTFVLDQVVLKINFVFIHRCWELEVLLVVGSTYAACIFR
jgi:RNA 3'-terminal phosphate cyclase